MLNYLRTLVEDRSERAYTARCGCVRSTNGSTEDDYCLRPAACSSGLRRRVASELLFLRPRTGCETQVDQMLQVVDGAKGLGGRVDDGELEVDIRHGSVRIRIDAFVLVHLGIGFAVVVQQALLQGLDRILLGDSVRERRDGAGAGSAEAHDLEFGACDADGEAGHREPRVGDIHHAIGGVRDRGQR